MENKVITFEESLSSEKPERLFTTLNEVQPNPLSEHYSVNNNGELNFKLLSDTEVVRHFIETQDEDSFNEIVNRYGEKIYRTALRITRNTTWAEDVLQEVLIKLVKSLETFNARAKFSTWVYRVTVNASFAHLRVEKKYRNDLSLKECDSKIEPGVSNGVDIENRSHNSNNSFSEQELMEAIEQALDKLPAPYRVVFHLRDVEGLTNPETAKILSLPLATVKFRIRRARLFLRDNLAGLI